jgi:N-acyl-D-amino-acid deacylase
MTEFDLWLRDGLIVDGTGRRPFLGDIGIVGDRIVAVGQLGSPQTASTVDCAGHVVVPGFIDIHTHSDLSFVLDPLASSKLVQGVTTEVTGNCGFSPFPVSGSRRTLHAEFIRGLGTPLIDITWDDFDGYARMLAARRPVMNVAPLVGHGALRIAVAGNENVAVDDKLISGMAALLREALEQGAFGLSTGLTYVPSGFAGEREIEQLACLVRECDALYATHARATPAFETFDEVIDVGRATGVRVQYSHVALNDPRMWGRADEVTARFQRAVDAGVDIRYDVYPYPASASSLTQYLPDWVQEGGEAAMRALPTSGERFRAACEQLAQGLYGTIPWNWDRVVLSLTGPGDEHLEGCSIADAAAKESCSPEELCLRLAARHGNSVQVVLFYRNEGDVSEFVRHPLAVIGSDGNAMPTDVPGRPHPRSFGTHARLLERYVIQEGHLPVEEAVHKSTQAPARRLGIQDRGVLATGMFADVAVLDLGNVRETASWTRPCQLAEGVREVVVNGERVVADSRLTGVRSGRVLRRSR